MSDCKKINCPTCGCEVEDTFLEQKCPRCQALIESKFICGSCHNCASDLTEEKEPKESIASKLFSFFKPKN